MYPARIGTELDVTQFTSSPLHTIGAGQCGSVWFQSPTEQVMPRLVIKREAGAPGRSLMNDYQIHRHVIESLKDPRVTAVFNINTFRINIPHCEAFLDPDAPEWSQILPMLPDGSRICNALISEKILPMPRNVRRLIAEKYCIGWNSDDIADRAINEHCLIRPYLGRRKMNSAEAEAAKDNKQLGTFTLRNYPLYSGQMEELGLPAWSYAVTMADALAFMHWVAKVDANDIEFVLAPPRRSNHHGAPRLGNHFQSECLGTHALWILDFDCCLRMTMDERGIKRACRSFWLNDPYYPKPGRHTLYGQSLWEVFRVQFLDTSGKILKQEEEDVRQLPDKLINMIEAEGKQR